MMYLFEWWIVFSIFCQCESTFKVGNGQQYRDDAEILCDTMGMDLMMMSTQQEYADAMDFLQSEGIDKALVGLKWNETLQRYQWNNGKLLDVVNWGSSEPQVQIGDTCVVMKTDGKWYTAPCAEANHYICSTGNDTEPTPSESTDAVNLYTAYRRCAQLQQSLPVLITQTQQDYFNGLPRNNDVWLGIYKCKNIFNWLTGVELPPPFSLMDGDNHLDDAHIEDDTVIHIYSDRLPFACQTRNTSQESGSGTYNLTKYYSRVYNMVPVMEIYLKEFAYIKKTECAMECSKSQECYQYTKNDSVCRLYGNVCFTDDSSGVPLWQRKRQ